MQLTRCHFDVLEVARPIFSFREPIVRLSYLFRAPLPQRCELVRYTFELVFDMLVFVSWRYRMT